MKGTLTMTSAFLDAVHDFYQMSMDEIEALMGSCGHWEHRDRSNHDFRLSWENRDVFTHTYAYSIPCAESMDALRWSGLPIIDCMAGSGYHAQQMRAAGLTVVAADDCSWNYFNAPKADDRYSYRTPWQRPDLVMDCAVAVAKHRGHAVWLSWPYMSPEAFRVASAMHQGQLLYYTGEGPGGCTANSDFFSLLDSEFQHLFDVTIPQFEGIHDELSVYRKKGRGRAPKARKFSEFDYSY